MKKSVAIIIVILVIVAGAGAYFLTKNSSPDDKTDTNTTATDTTQPQTQTTPDAATGDTASDNPAAAVTTITYTNGSFSPSTVTVKAGDTVEVKNAGGSLEFNSDPHPSHTNNPELNIGSISASSSKKITVKSKGTWGYHNHLNQSQTGTIVVQ